MGKEMSAKIKGVAILIMLCHHFIVMPFSDFPVLVKAFGGACKICVAIYAVLSGYGYYFSKEKTICYGLRKIWGLLKIYWISLFTIFIPAAILEGAELTPGRLVLEVFGLYPNLNWFAWYVYFYIFCMLIMPIIYRGFRFHPIVNLGILLVIPYLMELALYCVPNNNEIVFVHELISCIVYLPCFLIGFWMAENKVVEKYKSIQWSKAFLLNIVGIIAVFAMRILIHEAFGFLFDVFYAPLLICFLVGTFEALSKARFVNALFIMLGKYSTGMWFFHAAFFSKYVCDWFKPILLLVSWPPLMFVWLIILSLLGAVFYQKVLDGLTAIPHLVKRSS